MRLFKLSVTGIGAISHTILFTGPVPEKWVTVHGIYLSGWGYIDTNHDFFPSESEFKNDNEDFQIPIYDIDGLNQLVDSEYDFSPTWENEDEQAWFGAMVEGNSKGPRGIDFTAIQRGGIAIESGFIAGSFTIDEVDPDTKEVIKANVSLEDFFASNKVNELDDEGLSPLHQAVIEGSLEDVNRLLANHANINQRTNMQHSEQGSWKSTPLILSVMNDRLDIFHCLIEAGADIHAVDIRNRNAVSYAFKASEEGENPPDHYDGYIDTLLQLGADYKLLDVVDGIDCLDAYDAYARRKEKRTLMKGKDLPERGNKKTL
ncbi:MAG: ankyrin repeat domain-containing protein [Gallionella sp.]